MNFINLFFKVTLKIWSKNILPILIRLIGLTASMTFLILILAYLLNEYSYDNNIVNKENIYRILQENKTDSRVTALTSFPLKPLITKSIPEVSQAFRYSFLSSIFIKNGDDLLAENKFCFADNEIFENLNIELIDGTFNNTLNPYRVTISQNIAEKYFHKTDPIGKILTIHRGEKSVQAIVIAVFKNMSKNSTFYADIIGNFQIEFELTNSNNNKFSFEESFDKNYYTTYISIVNNVGYKAVEVKINQIIQDITKNSNLILRLQNLEDIYFNSSDIDNNFLPMGSLLNVKIFTIVCIFLILIATSNFIIISSAIHYYRKQEYIIRIINGAKKCDIIMLIFGEIFVLILLSMITSWGLITSIIPYANQLFHREILITQSIQIELVIVLICIVLIIGTITLFVISFYLFGKEKIISLETKQESTLPFFKFNKILVFAQIAAFTSLILISFIVFEQWNFLKSNQTLGFNIENILIVELPKELISNPDPLKNELEKNPKIVSCAEANNLPLFGPFCNSVVFKKEDYSTQYSISMLTIGENFFETIDISILDGRNFNLNGEYDRENTLLLNESAVKFLGLEGHPVGQRVMWKEVIGVVRDFHMESMYHEITPLIIYPCISQTYFLLVKYIGDKTEIEKYIGEKQIELAPFSELKLYNYSSVIEDTYNHEMVLKSVFLAFTLLTIILAIFGLIGLVIFIVQKRSKEIMIRTVHGASAYNISLLIYKEFFISLLFSNFVTYPLIWYYTNDWLNKFAFHIELRFSYFIVATLLTVLLIFSLISIIVNKHLAKTPTYYLKNL